MVARKQNENETFAPAVEFSVSQDKIAEAQKKVAKLRLELAAGKLKDVKAVAKARKELARWLTKKREEEIYGKKV